MAIPSVGVYLWVSGWLRATTKTHNHGDQSPVPAVFPIAYPVDLVYDSQHTNNDRGVKSFERICELVNGKLLVDMRVQI